VKRLYWVVARSEQDEVVTHPEDLATARRAIAGEVGAHNLIEQAILKSAGQAAAAARLGREQAGELAQRMRLRLLVGGPESSPALGQYAGRGPLAGYVRVVAAREATAIIRERASDGGELDEERLIADSGMSRGDAEALMLDAEARLTLKAAFQRGIARLSPRDRALLGFLYVQGLDGEAVGRIYDVHKATISRWLTTARSHLWELVAAELEGLRSSSTDPADPADLAALARNVASQLDLSLSRLLGP
jgi:RNA polymerase sigma-70 factor (ECF subfamily)